MSRGDAPGAPEPAQAPVIVVCSDGTGNSSVKGRGTNVYKLYEALDYSDARVIGIYDDGVGTGRVKLFRLLGGALGLGFSANVRQLYAGIARVWEPGAQIWLFGFSRGAFTVRTLAGMLRHCGLPRKCGPGYSEERLQRDTRHAYAAYRERHPAILQPLWKALSFWRWRWPRLRNWQRERALKATSDAQGGDPHMVPPVHFIGVWDTVDAVGFPVAFVANLWNSVIYGFRFKSKSLPINVRHARHALSLDDERRSFWPVLWDEPVAAQGAEPEEAGGEAGVGVASPAQTLEQLWFAGVHSNVGGGYPKQGLSDVTLQWMLEEAIPLGLPVRCRTWREVKQRSNVGGHLYDSRAGLGVYYRYAPRRLSKLMSELKSKLKSKLIPPGLTPVIHESVVERIARGTGGYAPGAWPRKCIIRGETDHPNWVDVRKDIERRLDPAARVHELCTRAIVFRQGIQFVALSITAAAIGWAICAMLRDGSLGLSSPLGWAKWALTKPEGQVLAVVLLSAWLLGFFARTGIEGRLARFWDPYRARLRASGDEADIDAGAPEA